MAKVSFYKDEKTEISVDEKKHGKYYIVIIKTNWDLSGENVIFDNNIHLKTIDMDLSAENIIFDNIFDKNLHLKTIGIYTTKGFGFDYESDLEMLKGETEKITKIIYKDNERRLNRNLKRVDKTAKALYRIFDFHKSFYMKHPKIEEQDIYICYAIPENKKEEQLV